MNEMAVAQLNKYRQLRDEVSELSEKLASLHKDEMACKKGCAECCMNFQVLPVEYFSILNEIKKDTPKDFGSQPADDENCNFLVNDLCQIYQSRPFICRTHGLPLLFMNQEGDAWELSACPLNFKKFDDFHTENTFPQDTYNSKLFLINQEFIKHYTEEQFGEFDLIPINRLVEDLKR
jgi:Fe-S-cluster containining protein